MSFTEKKSSIILISPTHQLLWYNVVLQGVILELGTRMLQPLDPNLLKASKVN